LRSSARRDALRGQLTDPSFASKAGQLSLSQRAIPARGLSIDVYLDSSFFCELAWRRLGKHIATMYSVSVLVGEPGQPPQYGLGIKHFTLTPVKSRSRQ
jgi:hypothetical protein